MQRVDIHSKGVNRPSWSFALALAGLVLGGCTSEELRGHYWNITLNGVDDQCTGAGVNYTEKLEYRMRIDGQEVTLAVGENEFAWGTINGCFAEYQSLVWTEDRNGYDVSWQIQGSATVNTKGETCKVDGKDWDGGEVFEVVNSGDPEISPGCIYTVAVSGTYIEEVK
jgi:hypothetical protein